MAKSLLAIGEIHKVIKPGVRKTATTPAVPPVIRIIKPGTLFVEDDDDKANALVRDRAAREPEKGETVAVPIETMLTTSTGEPIVGAKVSAPGPETTKARRAARQPKPSASGGSGTDGVI